MSQDFSITQPKSGSDPKFWKPFAVRIQSKTSLVCIQCNQTIMSVLRTACRILSLSQQAAATNKIKAFPKQYSAKREAT